jgi:hypothetical protein
LYSSTTKQKRWVEKIGFWSINLKVAVIETNNSMGRGTCANQAYWAMRLRKNSATSKDRDIRGAVSVKVMVGSPDSYALCDNIKLEDFINMNLDM